MPEPNTYMFDTEGFSVDLMEGGRKGGVCFNIHILFASVVQILLRNVQEHKDQRGRRHATRRHRASVKPCAGSRRAERTLL